MRRIVLGTLACLVMLASPGCGSSDGSDDDGGGGPVSSGGLELQKYVERSFQLAAKGDCVGAFECPERQSPRTITFASRFGDASTCVDGYLESGRLNVDARISALRESLDRGLSEYHGERAARCVRALERTVEGDACKAAHIFGNFDDWNECRRVVTGTQNRGAPCGADVHCKSGYCNPDGGKPGTCYGTCGGSPRGVGAGKKCGATTRNRCKSDADLICRSTNPGTETVCVKSGSVSAGDACSNSEVCADGLHCVSGTCNELKFATEGEPCPVRDSSVACEPGLVCHIESYDSESAETVCNPPNAKGDSCYYSASCGAGLYCEGAQLRGENAPRKGACSPQKANGEPCMRAVQCATLNCSSGTCSAGRQRRRCSVPN